MCDTRELEVIKFAFDLFFDLVEAFVIKAHQRLSVLFDQLHVITHSFRVGFDNMT
ncbi:hypothetical protein D3C73_1177060 [compost metagenome]